MQLPSLQIPNLESIATGTNQARRCSSVSERCHFCIGNGQSIEQGCSLAIPDANGSVFAAANNSICFRADGNCCDCGLCLKGLQQFAGCHIPQANGAIVAATNKEAAVLAYS